MSFFSVATSRVLVRFSLFCKRASRSCRQLLGRECLQGEGGEEVSSRRGRTYALELLLALSLACESEYQCQFLECSVRVKRRRKEGVRCASAGLAVFFAILRGCR